MKWYNTLILAILVVTLSIIIGYNLKKCQVHSNEIPVTINIDSIKQAQENEKKSFRIKIDSLENKLSIKPKTIIIYETSKDSIGHPDTTNIPSIFRKLAKYMGQ